MTGFAIEFEIYLHYSLTWKGIRATTSVVAKMCKMQKVHNFAHFNPKNTHINLCKNMQIYTTALQMNSNRAYVHGYCLCANDFFSLSSIKLLLFLYVYNNQQLPQRLQQPNMAK